MLIMQNVLKLFNKYIVYNRYIYKYDTCGTAKTGTEETLLAQPPFLFFISKTSKQKITCCYYAKIVHVTWVSRFFTVIQDIRGKK